MKSFLGVVVCAVLFVGVLVAGCTMENRVPPPVTQVRVPEPAPTVTMVTTSPLADPALSGPWLLKTGLKNNETLDVISDVEPILTFNNDGTLTVFGGCNYYKGTYTLTGQTKESRKTISMGPMHVISGGTPAVTFNDDGTFTVLEGCTCERGYYLHTGTTTELREPAKMSSIARTARYCTQTSYTETKYLRILQAAETYAIRNNIEYMNLGTAAGEHLYFRSGNL